MRSQNMIIKRSLSNQVSFFMERKVKSMAKKIGAIIALDNGAQFRSEVTSCNKAIAAMQSQLNLTKLEYKNNANSLVALEKKQASLKAIYDETTKKVSVTGKALENATNEQKRAGEEVKKYEKKLRDAEAQLDAMEHSTDTSTEALEEQKKKVEACSYDLEKVQAAYRKAGDYVSDWQKKLNYATAQQIKAKNAMDENEGYLKSARKSWKETAKEIDRFGNTTDTLEKKLTSLKSVLFMKIKNDSIEKLKSGLQDMIDTGVEGYQELEDAQAQLQASTGATARETKAYTSEMKELYAAGYADSIEEIANAMTLVKQNLNETDPDKIADVAENAMALEDVFGMDLNETLRGANALINEMGLDSDTAFNLMAAGAQNGLNKTGELADNLAEYAPLWAQAGFSAEEMFAILDNGLNSGAYNLDKVNDYVKEFGNSLADGRVESHIQAFSANTQTLFTEWQNGNASTKQVFQSVISDLASMENQQQALTIASDTWSSLGEDNAMKVITSLNNVNTKYQSVAGTMDKIKDTKYDSLSNEYKKLGRRFQEEIAVPIMQNFVPMAEKAINFVSKNLKSVTATVLTLGTTVGTLFTVQTVKKYYGEIKELATFVTKIGPKITTSLIEWLGIRTAQTVATEAQTVATGAETVATTVQTAATTAQTVATEGATVAQEGLNGAMSMNPAAMVVIGLVALVGTLKLVSDNMDDTKDKTDELAEEVKECSEEIQETTEDLNESFESWGDTLDEIGQKEIAADGLVSELYNLERQADKSSSELARMDLIVSQLNKMFPDLLLSVDKSTGALNKNEAQVKSSIKTSLEYTKAQAAQEKLSEIAEKMVDAEMKKVEAEQKLKEINERIVAWSKNHPAAYTERQLIENWKETKKLYGQQKEMEKTVNDLNTAYEEANEEYEKAFTYTQNLTESTGTVTEKVTENTEAVTDNGIAYNDLSKKQQQMAVDVTNTVLTMQESVAGVLESQMNMFEEFDKGTAVSKDTLLANMQSQIDGVQNWEENLASLAKKGINEGLLQKLIEMGPQATTYVEAFNKMSTEELEKANDMWAESIDIQNVTDQWGEKLLTAGAASVTGGMKNLNSLLKDSGTNTVTGLVQGMQAAQESAEAAGRTLGVKTVDSVNSGLGCASPSKKTRQSGIYTATGLVQGMDSATGLVTAAGGRLATAATTPIADRLTKENFHKYGENITKGLKEGIESGKSEVIESIKDLCEDTIRKAKEKLEIHSPSHVFRSMGNNTMDSFALGVTERRRTVKNIVAGAVDFTDVSSTVPQTAGRMSREDYNQMKAAWSDAASNMKFAVYLNGREVSRELSRMGVTFRA